MYNTFVIKPITPKIHPIWETTQSVIDIELFSKEPYWKLTKEERKIVNRLTDKRFNKYFLEGIRTVRYLNSYSKIDKLMDNLRRIRVMIRTEMAERFLIDKEKTRKRLLGK